MTAVVPEAAARQVSQAHACLRRHLAPSLLATYLHGSAVTGGLQPHSDLDLLAVVDAAPDDAVRQALMRDLLEHSAPPGDADGLRALEVTVVLHADIVPWRHPARRLLQFGEWLRGDIQAGVVEPPAIDPDLALLLAQARASGIALDGPPAGRLLDAVPPVDIVRALADTLRWWNTPADWQGDERNVVLTLARIWYTAGTGAFAAKDVAADWLLPRLPAQHRAVLDAARQAYLGQRVDDLSTHEGDVAGFVRFAKAALAAMLAQPAN